MPYQLSIDAHVRLIRLTTDKFIDSSEGKSVIDAVKAYEGFGPGMNVFIDARNTKNTWSIGDVKEFAFYAGPVLRGALPMRAAIVVASDVHFAFAGMIASLLWFYGVTMKVFRDDDGAFTWLKNELE